MFSCNLILILTISNNLYVRSSSEVITFSKDKDGLIETGEIGKTERINHCGFNLSEYPNKNKSFSGIFTNQSKISAGYNLSPFLKKFVGLSKAILFAATLKCAHLFAPLTLFNI